MADWLLISARIYARTRTHTRTRTRALAAAAYLVGQIHLVELVDAADPCARSSEVL